MNSKPIRALAAVAAVVLAAAGAGYADRTEAVTKPSGDVTLSFALAVPGRVAEVLVKEGDEVQADQALVQLDDAAERAVMERLKSLAQDTVRIRAQEAQWEQKKVDYQKMKLIYDSKAATIQELQHADLDVTIAALSVELVKSEHERDNLNYLEQKARVDRMRLTSPIAGRVEKIYVRAGESTDLQKEAVRVVNIDPLWIDAAVARRTATRLKVGQAARIEFLDDPLEDGQAIKADSPPRPTIASGKIVHVGAVADSASDTLTIRIELANPNGRPAGEHVRVTFPPAAAAPHGANPPTKDAPKNSAVQATTQPMKE